MTNEKITCTGCGSKITQLEVFPGNICVGCYEKEFDRQPVMTDQQLADMFRKLI